MRILLAAILLLILTACATSSGPVALLDPISAKYRITQTFGPNISPITGKKSFHRGLDMAAPTGTSIRAAAGGIVTRASASNGYGNLIEIDHGGGVRTRYAHLNTYLARKGMRVLPGQPIATVGSTGRSTGPHLHFEVLQNGEQIDPYRCIILGRRNGLVAPASITPATVLEGAVQGRSGL